jgi:hypothetical protein
MSKLQVNTLKPCSAEPQGGSITKPSTGEHWIQVMRFSPSNVVDGMLTRDEQIILGVLLSVFLAVFLITIICASVR